jgi:hypothetical protein
VLLAMRAVFQVIDKLRAGLVTVRLGGCRTAGLAVQQLQCSRLEEKCGQRTQGIRLLLSLRCIQSVCGTLIFARLRASLGPCACTLYLIQ